MKPLPPLFMWLDTTELSPFSDCIADLKDVEMDGKKIFTKLPIYVASVPEIVKQFTSISKLSIDELSAIYTYTMEFPKLSNGTNGSVYFLMNQFLRNQDRSLQPFLKYLRLLLSALYKLPAFQGKVCRGLKADIAADMQSKEKTKIVWNSFSSTTLNSKTLDNPMFLGKTGARAVLFIDCKSGRNVSSLSACQSEDEILMLPSTSFKVEQVLVQGDLTIVNLTEVDPLEDFSALFTSS